MNKNYGLSRLCLSCYQFLNRPKMKVYREGKELIEGKDFIYDNETGVITFLHAEYQAYTPLEGVNTKRKYDIDPGIIDFAPTILN